MTVRYFSAEPRFGPNAGKAWLLFASVEEKESVGFARLKPSGAWVPDQGLLGYFVGEISDETVEELTAGQAATLARELGGSLLTDDHAGLLAS